MSKADSTTSPVATPASYEVALAELERLVDALESGTMPLDDMLTSYRRGAELLAYCREKLQAVEDQVKLIDGSVFKAKRNV